ncbi:MAG: hypothetical protein LBH25_14230 [Fibromonadaceae bacterium]|jgi:hypothetical protein|nr:hypothetical protein [Fibromonadaceae bacterium]
MKSTLSLSKTAVGNPCNSGVYVEFSRVEVFSISDEEIQEECNMARYGNKYGKPNRNWEEDLKKVEEIRKRICLK